MTSPAANPAPSPAPKQAPWLSREAMALAATLCASHQLAFGRPLIAAAHPATAAPSRTEALFEEACRYIPGGSSRVHYFFPPHPLYAHSGAGCRLTDVDGVTRLDFVNNMTSLIHGHATPAIQAALVAQIQRGVAWSEPGAEELALARHLVERVPSIEKIRFGNSGTENVMLAVKMARQARSISSALSKRSL